MRTVLSRNLLESGLYAGQDGVILSLAETDGMTAGGLAQKLGVKAPTMTRTIGRMEAQGFLERKPDAEDARLTKVYLTELGRGSVQAIADGGVGLRSDWLRLSFREKEIRNLVRLLKRDRQQSAGRSNAVRRTRRNLTVEQNSVCLCRV